MLDNIFQSSYLNIKGQNQNLFQINLDFTDNSTNESTPESDTSKVCEDSINSLNVKKNKNFFLQKKRTRAKNENSNLKTCPTTVGSSRRKKRGYSQVNSNVKSKKLVMS